MQVPWRHEIWESTGNWQLSSPCEAVRKPVGTRWPLFAVADCERNPLDSTAATAKLIMIVSNNCKSKSNIHNTTNDGSDANLNLNRHLARLQLYSGGKAVQTVTCPVEMSRPGTCVPIGQQHFSLTNMEI